MTEEHSHHEVSNLLYFEDIYDMLKNNNEEDEDADASVTEDLELVYK